MESRKLQLSVGICAVLVGFSLAFAQDKEPASRPTPTPASPLTLQVPHLEVTPTELDYGQVWHGENPIREVVLKNTGTAPLEIIKITARCGCVQANKPKSLLAPGEFDILKIQYKSKNRVGQIRRGVTIQTTDPKQPLAKLTLTGEVKEIVEGEPGNSIAFGYVTTDERVAKSVDLTVVYDEKLYLKLKGPDDKAAPSARDAYELKLEEIEPGLKYRLTATTRPPLKPGVPTIDAILETDIERVPEVAVGVRAIVKPRVSLSTSRYYVSPRLNRATQRIVRLYYLTAQPVEITKIESDYAGIAGELRPALVKPQTGESSAQTDEKTSPASRPALSTPTAGRFSFHEITVQLPPGKDIPKGGAKLFVYTDDPDPRYSKLVVVITNEQSQRYSPRPVRRRPSATDRAAEPAQEPASAEPPADVEKPDKPDQEPQQRKPDKPTDP
ncbi:MAG TPA: DUF1573 domain-containing protein [Phycisphaerae bacterium]|nr:DUF1573 domain-containing protein [Phycisphaerae bacterium]